MTKADLERDLANVRAERDVLLEKVRAYEQEDADAEGGAVHSLRNGGADRRVTVAAPEGTGHRRLVSVGQSVRKLARDLKLRGVWTIEVEGGRLKGGGG